MALSNDLISQFVKATKDEVTTKTETTVYGTVVEVDGTKFVQIDGSEVLTPISSTADAKENDRVTVTIKDHSATIVGNNSSPSATTESVENVGNKITEVEILVADKVSTSVFDAEKGRIDELVSDNVLIKEKLTAQSASIDSLEADNVTINETLVAHKADIDDLEAHKLTATDADLKYATIENLNATNTNVYNLNATYGEFSDLTTKKLEAHDASINSLEANKLSATDADLKYATIENLNATNANVDSLEADVADIDTLIFGSASGTSIQTSFANAVIAQLGNAQIKSAMIESVSASQITAGDIITNNVRVLSEDGKLLISDETIQISDGTRVRVQIGKDASSDYSINIWDENGNLMFSKGGITDNAIKSAIIRNDMVSDTANISAHKLNIDSLFEEINDSTKTINSSKIYLDTESQTLDIAFTSISSDLDNLSNDVTSQGTQITAIQGQIESKLWQQDINTAVDEVGNEVDSLSTQHTSLKQTVDGISTTVATHTTEISSKADSSEVTAVNDKVTSLATDLDGFKISVSNTYTTKEEMSDYYTKEETDSAIQVSADGISSSVTNKINDIKIGGRNLLRWTTDLPITTTEDGTDGISKYRSGVGTLEETENGIKLTFDASVNAAISVPLVYDGCIENNEYVTLSFDYRGNITNPGVFYFMQRTTPNVSNNLNALATLTENETEWQHYSVTFANANANVRTNYRVLIFYGNSGYSTDKWIEIKKGSLILEKGNKETDWAPAPEDVDESIGNVSETADDAQNTASDAIGRVSVAESDILQLADMIATLVTDGNGASLMTQTGGKWTFSIGSIVDSLTKANEDIDGLSDEVNGVNGTLDTLKKAVNDLGVLADYVIITTYNGQPCIELGEAENEFKLRITNTEIQFADGTIIPAYVSNKKLMIEQAEVKNELIFGGFVWKARANGNMGLMWKGVDG